MRAKFTRQSSDERGVSPVIGVILMVAITVILAAVIGFFVLGLGGDQSTTPQASFSYNNPTLTMDNGDNLDSGNLQVLVDGSAASKQFSSDVSAGTSIDIGDQSAGTTISVVWTNPSGGDSSTLWKTTV